MFGVRKTAFRSLCWIERLTITTKRNSFHESLEVVAKKIRRKQSVTDVQKLQGYLEQTKSDKDLNIALTRTAKYDQEFDSFLKQYKDKNKEFANIIDLSRYAKDQNTEKSQEMREEEIQMLEEFRRRKQDKTIYLMSDDEQAKNEDDEGDDSSLNKAFDSTRFNAQSMSKDAERIMESQLDDKLDLLYGNQEFLMLIMARGTTTLVTTLNRINHFRYLVFMGNCNGVIGYGKGKGGNFEIALKNAVRDCKKNLIAIPLDHFMSLTAPVKVKYNGTFFEMHPRKSFNGWGNPKVSAMLLLAGIGHCSFKVVARNQSSYNLITCIFMALTRVRTPKELAEGMGHKIYHQHMAPWQYSNTRGALHV